MINTKEGSMSDEQAGQQPAQESEHAQRLETLAIHAGYSVEPTTKSVAVPIYHTSSYAFDNTQHGADLFDLKVAGNIYTRIMNPTNAVLEERVAALEGGIGALAVASGMAAITYAIQTICEAGDNIVAVSTLYGGTYNLFAHALPRQGIEVRFFDHKNPEAIRDLIDDKTKMVFAESIGNPLGNIVDIQALSDGVLYVSAGSSWCQFISYPDASNTMYIHDEHTLPSFNIVTVNDSAISIIRHSFEIS
mgnify:CR=1 FL=1